LANVEHAPTGGVVASIGSLSPADATTPYGVAETAAHWRLSIRFRRWIERGENVAL